MQRRGGNRGSEGFSYMRQASRATVGKASLNDNSIPSCTRDADVDRISPFHMVCILNKVTGLGKNPVQASLNVSQSLDPWFTKN